MSLFGSSASTGLTKGPYPNYSSSQHGPAGDRWDTNPLSFDYGHIGWHAARVSLRAERCPWHLTLVNTVSGHVISHPVKCESWTHRECAEDKAHKHLRHIARLFSRQERLWVAHADYDPALPNRLRQRRHARKQLSGTPSECIWIRRPNFIFVFATSSLTGRAEPRDGEWMEPSRAYGVARTVMWLPGIGDAEGKKAINYSEGWKRPSRHSSGLNIEIAIGIKPKDRQVVQLAYEHLGAGDPIPEIGGGWRRPPGVDQASWIESLTAANEIMANPH